MWAPAHPWLLVSKVQIPILLSHDDKSSAAPALIVSVFLPPTGAEIGAANYWYPRVVTDYATLFLVH
jgi:hypothetical protein